MSSGKIANVQSEHPWSVTEAIDIILLLGLKLKRVAGRKH